MRHPVLLLFACLAFASQPARAESTDPGDLFVNVYYAVQAGEKAEQAGNVREATSKFRYASQILEQIGDKFPTWRPEIIEYRKRRTAEALARLQDKAGKTGGGKGRTAETTAPVEMEKPSNDDSTILFPDSLPSPTPLPRKETSRAGVNRKPLEQPDLPSSNPIQQLDDRMKQLERDLQQARADAEKAQQEKADLAKQLQKAADARQAAEKKREVLEQRSEAAEAALGKAKADGKAESEEAKTLTAELTGVKRQLRDLKFEADAEAEFRQQLSDRLRSAQSKIARLSEEKAAAVKASADVPAKIADIQKQLDQARKEKSDLVTKLTKTETDLKTAMTQRDEALAQVTKMKEAQKQVDKLISDNASLMARLGEAEKTITLTKADGVKKDQEIAALRKETTSLKDQLGAAQKESADYQRKMTDLQTKLTEANTQIGQMKADNVKSLAERTRLQEENLLLRGVVLRQQKAEALRAQTKKLVFAELAKMENKSKVLMDQIEYLSGPVVKLSPKERALFKKPELQISDTEISLSAARPEEVPANSEAAPTPPTVDPAPALPATAGTEASQPAVEPLVKTPTANGAKPTEPVKTAEQKAPETTKPVESKPPVETAKTEPKTTPAPTTPKRSLSLETAQKPELELASNKQPVKPFSSLPDALSPPMPEKSTPKPSTTKPTPDKTMPPPDELPSKTPEKPTATPEKAAPETPEKSAAPTASEAPLAAGNTGTSNTSSTVMNLPADLVPQAREGKDQFERGNYRDAEKTYERILTKAPNNLYTLCNLGVVYFRSGKFKRAEEMFKKAIAIAPEDGFSHCTLGIVLYSQAKYDDAVTELTKALAINPKNATAHNYLGITASQKGWQEAALKELEKAVELDPTYADAHFNLAVVYATQQPPDKENARKFYKRATELGAEADTALEQLIK